MKLRILSILSVIAMVFCLVSAANAGTAELLASLTKQIDNSEHATPELKKFAKDKLLPLCTNAIFVKAVTEQNAKGITLDEIKVLDDKWQHAEDFLPIHEEMLGNACAKEIQSIAKANTIITEMFVMDNQGANVGQNEITSDYWQGDEAKWINSFNDGKGGVDISEPKLDKSTSKIDQKVSLPIIDASGKVIGAVCVGVTLD
ncbi:MAG: PDC sensor domain-containing protein [Candidatus Zixiibacteriota bacterium]